MGLFQDLIPKQEPQIPEETPVADPNDVGLFSDLINPQEKIQQQGNFESWLDDRVRIFGESMTAVKQGVKQAAVGVIDNLLGTEQWIGESVEKYGPKVTKKWAKNLAESSKAVAAEFDAYQREHPEEAIQISPDAGFWQATKEVVTSPANITKGLIQAVPLLLEAYVGGAAIKTASYAPRTAALVQKWGRIAAMSAGTFGSNYKDIRKKNVSPEAATAQAFLTSLGEGIVEEWTLSKKIGLFKSAKTALLKKSMGRVASTVLVGGSKAYARGMGEEAVQQLNENFWNLVFTDRNQDLTKGVAQAAAIGGPLEMIMAGGFTGVGLAARQMNKVDQLKRLDKMDDFIESTNLSPEEKNETHQVIENKRQEIEQTSILPEEEPSTETGAEQAPAEAEQPIEQPVEVKLPVTVKDETITPESMPEIHPDQEIAEVKIQNSVESTVDKLANLIETYKEPLESLGEEQSKELAKKWAKFEDIYMSGKEPELLHRALKTLEGELPHLKYRAIATDFTPEQIHELIWKIRTAPKLTKVWNKKDAEQGLMRILNGQEVRPFEVKLLQEVFGERLTEAIRKRGDIALSWYQRIADITNIPLATLTAFDLSGILRQGFILGLSAPTAWKEHIKTGYSILFSKDFKNIAEQVDFAIKTNEYYDFVKDKMGVDFTDWRSVTIEGLETKEEAYQSELAHKIPGISRSEAAYVLGLNKMRLDASIQFINEWKGQIRTDYDWKALGKFINLATGRGDVKALKAILPMLNGAFFAPRFFVSKFQLPIHLIRTMIKSPPVFKIMAGNLVRFVGVGALVLALASMIPGIEVDKDPESSDFGKIRYGDMRINFFQGYEQIVRTTVQLATGHRKSTITDRRLAAERSDIMWRYLQSKLSPVAGATYELFKGTKFDGTPVEYSAMELGKTALEKTVPLFIQDVYDAWDNQGFGSALIAAPAAFHGLGVQTYPIRPEQKATLVKQELARSYFGKDWDNIGPIAQQLLREVEPRIEESEVVARQQREGYPYLDEILKEQKASEKKVYRKLPDNVQDELDSTFSEIGGLSRRIGNGWFLNDVKYNQYTNDVSNYLNKALPLIVDSSEYKLLTNEQKKLILERVIAEIKTAIRKQLIFEGKREDVQTLIERTSGARK